MEDASFITVGRIVKIRGLRGEVKAQLYSGRQESIEGRETLLLRDAAGRTETFTVERIRSDHKGVYLTFAGIGTRMAAETLLRRELLIPRDELRSLESDEYFQFQLIGLCVIDADGRELGEVVDVQDNPVHDLLVIRRAGANFLVPAVKAFIRQIDLERGTILLQTIDGLLDE